MGEGEPTPEQLAEQLRRLKIEDLVVSTVTTLGQLAFVKLEGREFAQARLAIDAVAALVSTLEGHAEADLLRDLKQLLANLRLSFASAVSAGGGEPDAPGGAEDATGGEGGAPEAEAAERDGADG